MTPKQSSHRAAQHILKLKTFQGSDQYHFDNTIKSTNKHEE